MPFLFVTNAKCFFCTLHTLFLFCMFAFLLLLHSWMNCTEDFLQMHIFVISRAGISPLHLDLSEPITVRAIYRNEHSKVTLRRDLLVTWCKYQMFLGIVQHRARWKCQPAIFSSFDTALHRKFLSFCPLLFFLLVFDCVLQKRKELSHASAMYELAIVYTVHAVLQSTLISTKKYSLGRPCLRYLRVNSFTFFPTIQSHAMHSPVPL